MHFQKRLKYWFVCRVFSSNFRFVEFIFFYYFRLCSKWHFKNKNKKQKRKKKSFRKMWEISSLSLQNSNIPYAPSNNRLLRMQLIFNIFFLFLWKLPLNFLRFAMGIFRRNFHDNTNIHSVRFQFLFFV